MASTSLQIWAKYTILLNPQTTKYPCANGVSPYPGFRILLAWDEYRTVRFNSIQLDESKCHTAAVVTILLLFTRDPKHATPPSPPSSPLPSFLPTLFLPLHPSSPLCNQKLSSPLVGISRPLFVRPNFPSYFPHP